MRPPRIARAMLRICARAEDRASLLSEMQDELDCRATESVGAARRWYRRETRRSIGPLLMQRVLCWIATVPGRRTLMTRWGSEAAQAVRAIRRRPRVAILVVGMLGVALAATFAALAILDGVLLRSLPFERADRLVGLWNVGPSLPANVRAVSLQDLDDWRTASRTLDAVSAFTPVSQTLSGRGDPRRVEGMRVARDFDRVLAVRPALGRLFGPDDYRTDTPNVAVLTHDFWRREFGGMTDVSGLTVTLEDRVYRVVGVLPPLKLDFPTERHDYWIPLVARPGAPWEHSRATGWINAVARLRAGTTIPEARHELSAIAASLATQYPDSNRDRPGLDLRLLQDEIVGRAGSALLLVAAAVGALLLVAFGNTWHLLVAHAVSRRREFAVRHALGATPGRLGSQVTLEALLMAMAALGLALALAPALIQLVTSIPSMALPRQSEIALLPTVLRWGPGLLVLTAVVIIWPHVRLASTSVGLDVSSTRVAGHRGDRRVRQILLATQVALSALLMLGSVLFVRTLVALETVDLGFSTDGVITLQVSPSRSAAPSAARTMLFYQSVLDEVRSIPGVEAASASTSVPFVVSGWSFSVPAQDDPTKRRRHLVRVTVASPGHFDALRVAAVAGRPMSDDEHRGGPDAVVISRTLARVLFGDGDAVGQTFDYSNRKWTIVGVVPDLRQRQLADAQIAEIYLPWHNAGQRQQALVVRATGAATGLRDAIAARVHAIDPGATIADVAMLGDRVKGTLAPQRFRAILLSSLASLAVGLALFGVYSVTAFAVATQVREQAIRMALGETRGGARRRVLLGALGPAIAGALVGVASAWSGGRFIESFLFETRASDPLTLTAVAMMLVALTALASWLPAARAARLDPARVLRT